MSKWAVAMLLAAGATAGHAATQAPTEEQVRQLMEVVGVGKMLTQMNAQAVGVMQQSLPCIPASYWQNYVDANGSQQFIGRLVPIWQKHFTADEMEGMLKFYRSPLGQKVIAEMPATMAEATQAGQQWSHERSEQMLAELKQKGSLDTHGRCPATVASGDQPGDVEANEDEADTAAAAAATKTTSKKAATTKSKAKPSTKAKPKTPAKTTQKTTSKAPATTTKSTAKPASGTSKTTADKPAAKAASTPAATPASGS
ncbi:MULTISPECIES: DUF2059 domain-containing protein [Dyella]|uniref:DUF2059 domain-containing protein n=1 Tax=Dyella TaxID=231454 RepID=UPI001F0F1449|nr:MULTISPECIES: DUF2059 domain-containing protein [Dyella]